MTAPRHGVHRTEIQVRFGDTDALGHLNNVSYATYVELARLQVMRAVGGPVGSLILAHLGIDFRRQVTFGQAVVVESWIERIGTTSVTLLQRVLADEVVAAEVRSVVVHFDYAAQRPAPWPEAARGAMAPFVAGSA